LKVLRSEEAKLRRKGQVAERVSKAEDWKFRKGMDEVKKRAKKQQLTLEGLSPRQRKRQGPSTPATNEVEPEVAQEFIVAAVVAEEEREDAIVEAVAVAPPSAIVADSPPALVADSPAAQVTPRKLALTLDTAAINDSTPTATEFHATEEQGDSFDITLRTGHAVSTIPTRAR